MLLARGSAPFRLCLGPWEAWLGWHPQGCVPATLGPWWPETWVASHQVKARGPGLEKTGVAVNKPAEFTVDAKHGGKAPLRIQVQVGCPPVAGGGGVA